MVMVSITTLNRVFVVHIWIIRIIDPKFVSWVCSFFVFIPFADVGDLNSVLIVFWNEVKEHILILGVERHLHVAIVFNIVTVKHSLDHTTDIVHAIIRN